MTQADSFERAFREMDTMVHFSGGPFGEAYTIVPSSLWVTNFNRLVIPLDETVSALYVPILDEFGCRSRDDFGRLRYRFEGEVDTGEVEA